MDLTFSQALVAVELKRAPGNPNLAAIDEAKEVPNLPCAYFRVNSGLRKKARGPGQNRRILKNAIFTIDLYKNTIVVFKIFQII